MTRRGTHRRIPILLAGTVAIVLYALIWSWFKPILFSASKSDFSCFYRAGRMVMAGDGARVYDLAAQQAFDQRLGTTFVAKQGQPFSLPFVFPPYTLALFAPLSCLPYRVAEFVWYVANVGMLLALPLVLRISLAASDRTIAAELLAPVLFLPAVLALMQGQTSILLLLLFAMTFATLAKRRETAAGCILAFALLKPQLALPLSLALAIWRKWRALAAMFWTGVALLGLSAAIAGWHATLHYPRALLEFNHLSSALGGEHPESMPNLRGAVYLLLPGRSAAAVAGITIVLSMLLLAVLAILLKPSALSRTSYSLVLIAGCLVSYHAYLHDDSLLLLPILLITDELQRSQWTATRAVLAAAMGALYVVPLLPTSLSATALQMSAVMAILAAVLGVEMRNTASREAPEPAQQQFSATPAFSR